MKKSYRIQTSYICLSFFNLPTKRIFWYLVRQLDAELSKKGLLSLINQSFSKMIKIKDTVGPTWKFKTQILFSKWAYFKRVWHILKLLSRPCPLDSKWIKFGGFQNGAPCLCISSSCKVTLCQSWSHCFYRINGHPRCLAEHNFAAPWATRTYCIFLETFKPDSFGAKRAWAW